MGNLSLVLNSRERDLGGFSVRRLLPYASHRMVGPFIFFDHMGPAEFPAGAGMDVRPHPHIHLATVSYLFEGKIEHRDSLGSDQLIEPGAINWMTAGRGIVHSERTPKDLRKKGSRLSGIQLWVALPEESENTNPSFVHHPSSTLPEFTQDGVKMKLLLGNAFGHSSPVATLSELFYIDATFPEGTKLTLPANGQETAVYVVSGNMRVEDKELKDFTMGIGRMATDLTLEAKAPSRVMLLGGKPIGKRFIDWNFVSSSEKNIVEAKAAWKNGPGEATGRFSKIPGDDQEFIPLPEEPTRNSKGTIF
jgi:redox-sensitive bicupin YhaK (pirin superfamily)